MLFVFIAGFFFFCRRRAFKESI